MDSKSVAIGYALGYNDGLLDSNSTPSPDWQPPESWIPVPEPGDYDIYILIQTYTNHYDTGKNFEYILGNESNGDTGYELIHCDWGDDSEGDYGGIVKHTYAEYGQYLVHITANENTTFCRGSASNQAQWLIFKSGAKMTFFCEAWDNDNSYNHYNGINTFSGKNYLKYVKVNHSRGVPLLKRDYFFNECQCLQKLELKPMYSGNILPNTFSGCCALKKFPIDFDNIDSTGKDAFSRCLSLKKLQMTNCLSVGNSSFSLGYGGVETVYLPNCTSIDNFAFDACYNLKSVYAPNCVSVGNYAFQSCYNLQEIIVAEDCTFGTNCFRNCYSLYPRPDGSIN